MIILDARDGKYGDGENIVFVVVRFCYFYFFFFVRKVMPRVRAVFHYNTVRVYRQTRSPTLIYVYHRTIGRRKKKKTEILNDRERCNKKKKKRRLRYNV